MRAWFRRDSAGEDVDGELHRRTGSSSTTVSPMPRLLAPSKRLWLVVITVDFGGLVSDHASSLLSTRNHGPQGGGVMEGVGGGFFVLTPRNY